MIADVGAAIPTACTPAHKPQTSETNGGGLWARDAEPPRGAMVHRDASGEPTGIATEI